MKIKIKQGDQVKVLAGKYKGKEGKVMQVLPKPAKVVVEGVNVAYKHMKSHKRGESGQKIEFFAPVDISNVQIICPKCKKTARLGIKVDKDNQKIRVCKKCEEVID